MYLIYELWRGDWYNTPPRIRAFFLWIWVVLGLPLGVGYLMLNDCLNAHDAELNSTARFDEEKDSAKQNIYHDTKYKM